MDNLIYKVSRNVIVGLFLGILCLPLLLAIPTLILWNAIMSPEFTMKIFGMPHLNYLHSLGLNILCALLFKSSASSKSE